MKSRMSGRWLTSSPFGTEATPIARPGEEATFKTLDTIVLAHDLPRHGLEAGDKGVVVEIYPPDGLEVEFVAASGQTRALLTLKASDLRSSRG
jgi:hypothetical protein